MTPKISVLSSAERVRVFGELPYSEAGGGRITVSQAWVSANIVACSLAKADGKGRDVHTRCHRLAKEPLEHAFAEIAKRGLWPLIHSFDGLWVPRHMTWNSARPLSSHSWGIAFDLNASRNPYGGGVSAENRALNEVFNLYGFAWGGDWNGAKDAMHWELADVDAWKQQREAHVAPRPIPRLILAVAREGTFSYHAVPNARLENSQFQVNPLQVSTILGAPLPSNQPGSEMSLRPLLEKLEAQIVKEANKLSDAQDPRYYVFVRPATLHEASTV